jgi:hypothetical protein
VNFVAASSSDYAGVNPCCPACASGSAPRSLLVAACERNTVEGRKTHHQTELTYYFIIWNFVSVQTGRSWSRVILRPCAITALFTYNMTASKGKSSTTDPPSPSASFYDLSDDEEGEYNTIAHSSAGKGVKLLFSKSKVSCAAALKNKLQA